MLGRIDAVVPARDEARSIGACIDALLAAGARALTSRPGLEIGVAVVLDDCRDDTERIVLDRLDGSHGIDAVVHPLVEHSVGAARRAGTSVSLDRSVFPLEERWIANTDADSRVPIDWFEVQAAAFDAGVDVLLGTVRPDFDEFSAPDVRRWLETHPPGHLPGNVHGANLGVRADRYAELGGFSEDPEHEDIGFVERARAAGFRIVPTLDGVVATSGRRRGRTPGGYAAFLAATYPQV